MFYQMRGQTVYAIVAQVNSYRAKTTTREIVYAEYKSVSGETILAMVTNAPEGSSVGDQIVGKVLSNNPQEIFVEPPAILSMAVNVFAGACFLIGMVIIILRVRKRLMY